jgi:hypothetical protein
MMPNPYHEWARLQTADRVQKAYRERLAKDTRKGRISSTRRALTATAAVMAWLTRLVGGGGGI